MTPWLSLAAVVRFVLSTLLLGVLTVQLVGFGREAVAQEKKPGVAKPESKVAARQEAKKPDAKSEAVKPLTKPAEPAIDEKAALVFASTHHAELAELLQTLKKSNKTAYVDALNDVAKDQERLARMADRDTDRHALAIELWKLDSRIRLEMAKFAMSQDSERESRVKGLLKQRLESRRRLLELDKKRSLIRSAKIEEQLAALGENSDERAAAELERLKKSVAGKGKPKKSGS